MNRPNPTRRQLKHGGGGGGREDCWSDGATETLIEAWGDRYIQLNRGNLRQKDWKDIAGAVNARQNGIKPPKTDIQCKNRVDTLKKKYKVEKFKSPPSKWVFYHRLHSLIGANAVIPKKATAVTLTVKSSKTKPDPTSIQGSDPPMYSGGGSVESSLGVGDDDDVDGDDVGFDGRAVRKQRIETMDFSDGGAFRELARAILRFGEIYERIESSKQQQMMELEKQRMEFTKDLEFQRLNMYMDTQLEVQKMKRPKYSTTSVFNWTASARAVKLGHRSIISNPSFVGLARHKEVDRLTWSNLNQPDFLNVFWPGLWAGPFGLINRPVQFFSSIL